MLTEQSALVKSFLTSKSENILLFLAHRSTLILYYLFINMKIKIITISIKIDLFTSDRSVRKTLLIVQFLSGKSLVCISGTYIFILIHIGNFKYFNSVKGH